MFGVWFWCLTHATHVTHATDTIHMAHSPTVAVRARARGVTVERGISLHELRNATPGPGSYYAPPFQGKQMESKRRTVPAAKFGTDVQTDIFRQRSTLEVGITLMGVAFY